MIINVYNDDYVVTIVVVAVVIAVAALMMIKWNWLAESKRSSSSDSGNALPSLWKCLKVNEMKLSFTHSSSPSLALHYLSLPLSLFCLFLCYTLYPARGLWKMTSSHPSLCLKYIEEMCARNWSELPSPSLLALNSISYIYRSNMVYGFNWFVYNIYVYLEMYSLKCLNCSLYKCIWYCCIYSSYICRLFFSLNPNDAALLQLC